jgi:hypothetical protein
MLRNALDFLALKIHSFITRQWIRNGPGFLIYKMFVYSDQSNVPFGTEPVSQRIYYKCLTSLLILIPNSTSFILFYLNII